jgi:hypothetical protein
VVRGLQPGAAYVARVRVAFSAEEASSVTFKGKVSGVVSASSAAVVVAAAGAGGEKQ